ncbi:hypothetical protein V2J09_016081 [Rumex salicifolius]
MGYDMDRCRELFDFMLGVRHYFVYPGEPDWTVKLHKGHVSIKEFFMHVVGMMKQHRKRDHHCIAAGFLWHAMSTSIFVDKSTNELNTNLLALFEDSKRLGLMAWGVGVLALLYRNLGHASRGMVAGNSECTYLIRRWIWQYFMYFLGNPNPVLGTTDNKRRARRYHIDRMRLQTMKNAMHYRRILDEYRSENVGLRILVYVIRIIKIAY